MQASPNLFAFWSPGPGEMLLILGVALLLYGGKLPEVARSWGQSLAELRRGLSGIQNDINQTIYADPDTDRLPYYAEESEVGAYDDEDGVEQDTAPDNPPAPA